eukprot:5352745-Pyramimonas_sp.AAC.1
MSMCNACSGNLLPGNTAGNAISQTRGPDWIDLLACAKIQRQVHVAGSLNLPAQQRLALQAMGQGGHPRKGQTSAH